MTLTVERINACCATAKMLLAAGKNLADPSASTGKDGDWMGIEAKRKQNMAIREAVKFIDKHIPEPMEDAFYEIGARHSGADTDFYCRIERWQKEPKIDICVRKATPMECAIEAISIFKQPYKALAAIGER